MGSEGEYTTLLRDWFENEKKHNGLIDFKPYIVPGPDSTVESIAFEILDMMTAPEVECKIF